MIVLDTNVVSELARPAPDQRVIDWVDGQDSSDLVITVVTAAEVRAGVALLPEGPRRDDIVAARKRAGTPISALDAQIAAICRQYEATLATRNLQDFTASGVELVDPWRS